MDEERGGSPRPAVAEAAEAAAATESPGAQVLAVQGEGEGGGEDARDANDDLESTDGGKGRSRVCRQGNQRPDQTSPLPFQFGLLVVLQFPPGPQGQLGGKIHSGSLGEMAGASPFPVSSCLA